MKALLGIYEEAWKRWGARNQRAMLAEECCELAQAALKQDRLFNGRSVDSLCEEIADVELLIESVCHNQHLRERVDQWRQKKIARLINILRTPDALSKSPGEASEG